MSMLGHVSTKARFAATCANRGAGKCWVDAIFSARIMRNAGSALACDRVATPSLKD